jgi:plastocyanin
LTADTVDAPAWPPCASPNGPSSTFTVVGEQRYDCAFHPTMSGVVVIER